MSYTFTPPYCRSGYVSDYWQFRLTEETYGIVFTGEVRGFFLKNSKPAITLSLSKKFDLGDLCHAIVKPFTPGIRLQVFVAVNLPLLNLHTSKQNMLYTPK